MFNVGRLAQILSDPKNWIDRYFLRLDELYSDNAEVFGYVLAELEKKGADTEAFSRAFTKFQDRSDSNLRIDTEILTADKVVPREQEFVIPYYIPRGEITILAGDGGLGKTTVWCDLASALTAGRMPFFIQPEILPKGWDQIEPERVAIFTNEEAFDVGIIKRLKAGNADLSRIVLPEEDAVEKYRFDRDGIKRLEQLILLYHVEVLIFDPVQDFLPDIKMNDRRAMRASFKPLANLCHKYGVTAIIAAHANKTPGVFGVKRIAESNDMPNVSRSVLMLGYTDSQETTRYMSHEKTNVGIRGKTTLFTIEGDQTPHFCGYSKKHDREYVLGNSREAYISPIRDAAKDFVLEYLEDGEEHLMSDLDAAAAGQDISVATLKRAKTELRQEEQIKTRSEGFGNNKVFYVSLAKG